MKYNFDEIIDRRGNHSMKYDDLKSKFGTTDVIPLWVADMDFKTAQPVIDAIYSKAEQGIFGYVSRPQEYFDSIISWQKRRNDWDIPDKSLLSFALGVVPTLGTLVRQFAKRGEPILFQPPVYPDFFEVCKSFERPILQNRLIERDGVFHLDIDDFEAQLKKGPKAFILCNPQNPTGHAWRREELAAMGELCVRYNVPIISDEIHADLMLFGNKHIPMATVSPEIAANTITCTSISKTFNLAGLQAATVIFNNADVQREYDHFWHGMDTNRNNCFSLVASMAAYSEGEEWLDQLIPYLEENMRFIKAYCEDKIPQIKVGLPEATYLMWLDCRGLGLNDDALEAFMIKKAGLGLNAGRAFDSNLSGYMRLNAACPRPILQKAMKQLEVAVKAI